MREALAGMTPSCMGDNALGIALDAVANKTPDQPNVISGTDVFVLTGCRMSASGMGEGIEVVVRDGTKAAKVTAESGTGQSRAGRRLKGQTAAKMVAARKKGEGRALSRLFPSGVCKGLGGNHKKNIYLGLPFAPDFCYHLCTFSNQRDFNT